jgi:hypothetical protein
MKCTGINDIYRIGGNSMNIIKQYVRTNSFNETETGTSTYTETIRVFENGKLIYKKLL